MSGKVEQDVNDNYEFDKGKLTKQEDFVEAVKKSKLGLAMKGLDEGGSLVNIFSATTGWILSKF